MRLPPPLVALTPGIPAGDPARGQGLLRAVDAALAAGVPGILLREPALDERAFLDLATALRERTRDHGAWFGVHDRAHVAEVVGADGLHLGFRSLAPADVPGDWRAERVVGLSTHDGDAPVTPGVEGGSGGGSEGAGPGAKRGQADYVVFGPVLDTPSKRGLVEPVGFDRLGEAARCAPVPVWGVGGLRPEHAEALAAQGARGGFVLGGILGAVDPGAAGRLYADAFRSSFADLGGARGNAGNGGSA